MRRLWLHGSFIFEDAGVTAYEGAVGALTNTTLKSVASRIGSVEAYHASEVRTFLFQQKDVVTIYNVSVCHCKAPVRHVVR